MGLAVFPGDSVAYWTRYLVDGLRGGPPASFDNRSILAFWLRRGLDQPWPMILAGACGVLVAIVAFRHATQLFKAGHAARAAILVGCLGATLSPLAWSHHQVPVVLAGLLLVSSRGLWHRGWGAAITTVMSAPVLAVQVALDWELPTRPTWVAEIPLVCALTICLVGLPWADRGRR